METASRHNVLPVSQQEARQLLEEAFSSAKSRLENRRKEKILRNIGHDSKCEESWSSGNLSRFRSALKAIDGVRGSNLSSLLRASSRPPSGLSWVRVHTNMRTPEGSKDTFFVPYLGESDAHQNFCNTLAADAFPMDEAGGDDISDVDSAPDDLDNDDALHISPTDQKKSDRRGGKRNGITLAPKSHSLRTKKNSQSMWDRAAQRVSLAEVMEKLNILSSTSIAAIACDVFGLQSVAEVGTLQKNATHRRKKYAGKDNEERKKEVQGAQMLRIIRGNAVVKPMEALQGDSIPFFICRQCYEYNCFLHGNQTAKPSILPEDKTRKDHPGNQISEAIDLRCVDRSNNTCWHVSRDEEESASWWEKVRDSDDGGNLRCVLEELFISFGKDPCRVAELTRVALCCRGKRDLRITCNRIGYLLTILTKEDSPKKIVELHRRPRKKNAKLYRMKPSTAEMKGIEGGRRVDFVPCQHDGPCTSASCRCVENGVSCEKFCSCNHARCHGSGIEKRQTCQNAFQGCTCKSSTACISNNCMCYSWGRECDPDLCRACHSCAGGKKKITCRNIGLLMGERQRTVVGHSLTHGWGAFAVADISKNDIIGEYVGEVVSQADAELRGRLYDEIDYSFLFNITDDYALDSTRLGNKLRYCNHHLTPNCQARLMRVHGDIRVGLYAIRDIGKNEELFFDYKYKNGPAWAMPGHQAKPSSYDRKKKSALSAKKRAFLDEDDEEVEVMPTPKKRLKREREPGVSRGGERNSKTPEGARANDLDFHEVKNDRGGLSVWRSVLQRVATSTADVDSLGELPQNARVTNSKGSNTTRIVRSPGNDMNDVCAGIQLLNEKKGRIQSHEVVDKSKLAAPRRKKVPVPNDDSPEAEEVLSEGDSDASAPKRRVNEIRRRGFVPEVGPKKPMYRVGVNASSSGQLRESPGIASLRDVLGSDYESDVDKSRQRLSGVDRSSSGDVNGTTVLKEGQGKGEGYLKKVSQEAKKSISKKRLSNDLNLDIDTLHETKRRKPNAALHRRSPARSQDRKKIQDRPKGPHQSGDQGLSDSRPGSKKRSTANGAASSATPSAATSETPVVREESGTDIPSAPERSEDHRQGNADNVQNGTSPREVAHGNRGVASDDVVIISSDDEDGSKSSFEPNLERFLL